MPNRGVFGSVPSRPSSAVAMVAPEDFRPGVTYGAARVAGQQATLSWGLNQLWLVPFFASSTQRFDQATIYMGATANARLGIYAGDGSNRTPGSLIADWGVIAGVGAGDKTLSISQLLRGGMWYWIASLCDTTVTWASTPQGYLTPMSTGSPSSGVQYGAHYRNVTYGPLPSWAGPVSDAAHGFAFTLRAAA